LTLPPSLFPIRVFGDEVLFTPTQKVDFTATDHLVSNINKMLATLRREGGVGIAANQCMDIPAPVPSIIIVGIASAAALLKAQVRYPGVAIPAAEILINPSIIERSPETYFPIVGEGCLSIPCTFRGKVARHRWVIVRYNDLHGETFEEKFTELRSHIVQHECDHLQGVVFIQKLIHDMQPTQRQAFGALIDEVLAHPTPENQRPPVPTLGADRDENGTVLLNKEIIIKTLSGLDEAILVALKGFVLSQP